MNHFTSPEGGGYSYEQAAGITARLEHEGSWSTTIGGDGGRAVGFAQWQPDRWNPNKAWAEAQGLDPYAPATQLAMWTHELATTERAADRHIRAAQTAQQAAVAMLRAERPTDWQKAVKAVGQGLPDPTTVHLDDTISTANRIARSQPGAAPAEDQGTFGAMIGEPVTAAMQMANAAAGAAATLAHNAMDAASSAWNGAKPAPQPTVSPANVPQPSGLTGFSEGAAANGMVPTMAEANAINTQGARTTPYSFASKEFADRPNVNVPSLTASMAPANAMDAASRPFTQPAHPSTPTPPPGEAAAVGRLMANTSNISAPYNVMAGTRPAVANAMDAASRPFNAAEMAAARAGPPSSMPAFRGPGNPYDSANAARTISPGGMSFNGAGLHALPSPVSADKLSPGAGDRPGPVQSALSSFGHSAADAASRAWNAVSSAASGMGGLNHPSSGPTSPQAYGGPMAAADAARAAPARVSSPQSAADPKSSNAASAAATAAKNAAAAAVAAQSAYDKATGSRPPGSTPNAKPGELGSAIQTQDQWNEHVAALKATADAAAATAAGAAKKAKAAAAAAVPTTLAPAPVMDPKTAAKPAPKSVGVGHEGDPVFDDTGKQVGTIDATGKAVGLTDTWGDTAKKSLFGGLFGGLPGAIASGLPSALGLNSAAGWGGPVGNLNNPPTTSADVIGPTGRPGYTGKINNGVQDRANQLGLGHPEAGYHFGWSPIGNGVASVYDGAPEGIQIAGSGSGLLGALGLAGPTGYTGYKGPTPSSLASSAAKALGSALSPKMPNQTQGTRGGVTNLGGVMQGYADSNKQFNDVGNMLLGIFGGGKNSGGDLGGGRTGNDSGQQHG